MVKKIMIELNVSIIYKNIRLAGSGAVNKGRINLIATYIQAKMIPALRSGPFMIHAPLS